MWQNSGVPRGRILCHFVNLIKWRASGTANYEKVCPSPYWPGTPRHTHFLAIIWENNSYSPKCWCSYQHSPTIKTTTKGNTLVHWNFRFRGNGNFLGDFASDGSDFDAADGNSYKDYYSDDDDLFSLDDVSHSELRDVREAWNALT